MTIFRALCSLAAVGLLSACSPEPSVQGSTASNHTQAATSVPDAKAVPKPKAEAPVVSHPPLQIVPEPSGHSQNGGQR